MNAYKYQVTIDDWMAFNRYHLKYSPLQRKNFRICMGLGVFLGICFCLFGFYHYYFIIGGLVFTILYLIFIFRAFQGRSQAMLKMIQEGENRALFSKQELSYNSDGIFHNTEHSKSELNWSCIEKIIRTDDYIFIYIGSIQAYIVPLRYFEDHNKNEEFCKGLLAEAPENCTKFATPKKFTTHYPTQQRSAVSSFLSTFGFIFLILLAFLGGYIYNISSVFNPEKYQALSDFSDSLVITSYKIKESDGPITVIGQISNSGNQHWQGASLEASFYGPEKELLDLCSGYIIGKIQPESKRAFKIQCNDKFEYTEFEISIQDAYPGYENYSEL